MPESKSRTRIASRAFAAPADFCQIFSEEMNSLYLLAFLLTADQDMAERCFLSALEDCRKINGVFKKWARTWTRRTIVKNAIRMVQPVSGLKKQQVPALRKGERFADVMALAPFERFVFVLSVLEAYSDQDCKGLLGCLRREIAAARTRAFEQIGNSGQRVHRTDPGFTVQSSQAVMAAGNFR